MSRLVSTTTMTVDGQGEGTRPDQGETVPLRLLESTSFDSG
jgi:hypothetical protein